MAAAPLLRVDRYAKRFGEVVANDAISLEVFGGEIHCLLGENGAGKSTLCECLYGHYRPDSGRLFHRGRQVFLRSPQDAIRLGIGMVHQHFNLVEPLTVLENIAVGSDRTAFLLDFKQARARLGELSRTYGLDLDLDQPVAQLSVGEQQWVEILKALYLGAELLILDEPTAVLTPPESERLFRILRRMTAAGQAVLLITHKLNEVQRSDRVTVLRGGRVVGSSIASGLDQDDLTEMMIGRRVVPAKPREAIEPGPTVLAVEGLTARHDRGHLALNGIDLTLRRSEILGLAGVSGNGQRELFEVLVGVRRAEAGEVRLDGEAITNLTPAAILARGIGHIPDDRFKRGLVGPLTIAENLILGRQHSARFSRLGFLRRRAIDEHGEDRIAAFDVAAPSARSRVDTLSGGNAQKLIIAREFEQASKCLLCNQATRGLDVGVIETVHHLLRRKRREGFAILYASEELDDLLALSDRIAVIFKGRIAALLDPEAADIGRIGALMAGAGGQ